TVAAEGNVSQLRSPPLYAVVALEQADATVCVIFGSPRFALVLRLCLRQLFGGGADKIGFPTPVKGILENRAMNANAAAVPGHFALEKRVLWIEYSQFDTPAAKSQIDE